MVRPLGFVGQCYSWASVTIRCNLMFDWAGGPKIYVGDTNGPFPMAEMTKIPFYLSPFLSSQIEVWSSGSYISSYKFFFQFKLEVPVSKSQLNLPSVLKSKVPKLQLSMFFYQLKAILSLKI
jgi:hypothetical protein